MDYTKRAKEIIEKILYATVASITSEGEPWNSPVYFAYDKDTYAIYWVSPLATTHTRNIAAHPGVFLVIYDSTVPEGTGEGVYIQAHAEEVTDQEELRRAIGLLYSRKSKPPRDISAFLGNSPRRIYKATPREAWMNGTKEGVGGVLLDKRIEIKLP